MTVPSPPWCLQWSSDGELIGADRQDLLLGIGLQEQGLARALLERIADPGAAPSPRAPAAPAPSCR